MDLMRSYMMEKMRPDKKIARVGTVLCDDLLKRASRSWCTSQGSNRTIQTHESPCKKILSTRRSYCRFV